MGFVEITLYKTVVVLATVDIKQYGRIFYHKDKKFYMAGSQNDNIELAML